MFNAGWQSFAEWPPAAAQTRSYYLSADAGLAQVPASGSVADSYAVDFTHSSTYGAAGSQGANRWLMMYLPDEVMNRASHDRLTQVYETPPLTRALDVAGHPVVEVHVSSSQPDGDLYVYLSEVTPDGDVIYAAEGQLRAGWHRLSNDDAQIDFRTPVLPDLPYHNFARGQYAAEPFANSAIVKLRFALNPIAYRFRAGHRLRIAIAGADANNFEMNPAICSGNAPEDCPPTTLRIHRGEATPSRIELPVVLQGSAQSGAGE